MNRQCRCLQDLPGVVSALRTLDAASDILSTPDVSKGKETRPSLPFSVPISDVNKGARSLERKRTAEQVLRATVA
jgi:hypothetical protein